MNTPSKKPDNLYRVFRGGGWHSNDPSWVRASRRFWNAPSIRNDILGVRCVLRGREPRARG